MGNFFSSRITSLSKRKYRLAAVAMLLIGALLLGVSSLAPVAHAASRATTQAEQCEVVLGVLQPGKQASPVLFSQCAQGNQQSQLVVPASSTLLMSLYKDANYEGASTLIYGGGGPCDNLGYGIPNLTGFLGLSSWNDVVSSFHTWNGCNNTRAYVNINYGSTCHEYWPSYNVPNVGAAMNDKISSFRVNDYKTGC